ncbi:peptidylprolyl isomerase [Undibacterium sp. SXout20W]|uniref:peptidylprolyl isomerase n=1 Tax=Undibacterium sp. SXout20W TaxID=3413051 RepID=UPI003BF3014C
MSFNTSSHTVQILGVKTKLNHLSSLAAIGLLVTATAGNAATSSTVANVVKENPLKSRPATSDIVKASGANDWRAVDPDNTLYLELNSGRVVIELAPDFAPNHVDNIRKLVREGYFDGLAIVRSQDNYVVQWADPDEKREVKTAKKNLAPEFTVKYAPKLAFNRLFDVDGYAPQVGFTNGFAAGRDTKNGTTWLAHCYGAVGVARGNEVNSGDGTSLYVVTGNAPRQLDRNITVVGRVVQGMPLLSALPRGTAALGFYEKPEQNSPIKAIRIAADVPVAERTPLEIFRTDTPSFKAVLEAQRNRGGDWYKVPAGHVDLCNVQVPVREKKAE